MTMTIPFARYFKRKAIKEHPIAAPAPAAAPVAPHIEKPSSERMSKTVVPQMTRVVGKDDYALEGNGAPKPATNGKGGPAPKPRVAFSMNTDSALPPAVALALEPKVERAISLDMTDVLAQMPEGVCRPLSENDATRRLLLKAAEIEKGMATGKPSVSIFSVYQQVPEIFVNAIKAEDTRQVQLPMAKVMEQFGKFQLRNDQYRDQIVPQVETPFLQVTLEDNTRFGITMEPIQTGELPPVRLVPATAESIAAFEPEWALREKSPEAPPQIQLTPLRDPSQKRKKPVEPAAIPPQAKAAPGPARVPFKLTPNGTDAPAAEGVPASGGPSVPTSAPTRIPFKVGAPSDDLRAKPEPWITKESFAPIEANGAVAPNETKISLPLKTILQSLPPFQLKGDVAGVPDDARLILPFALVEKQLMTGRVILKPAEFAAALAEEYRGLFNPEQADAPVALPLQEILKNLPDTALQMRTDQVEEEKGGGFVTPFSTKAEEDAQRFNGTPKVAPTMAIPTEPVAATAAVVEVAPTPSVPAIPKVAPAENQPAKNAAGRTALQEILETDEEVDAKAVVAYIDKMTGVKACAILFADGLSLAGNLPESYGAEGLCAMAPSFLQRLESHLAETKLGGLQTMTLACAEASVTFLMQGNLSLAALHAEELSPDVRQRLTRIVHELSQKYSHPV
jgi:predicted regulator of Ras-like GTPase activity (Roadblock/LC7/MglB family)